MVFFVFFLIFYLDIFVIEVHFQFHSYNFKSSKVVFMVYLVIVNQQILVVFTLFKIIFYLTILEFLKIR